MHGALTAFALKALCCFHEIEGDTAPHKLLGLFELLHCRSPSALISKSLYDLKVEVYFLHSLSYLFYYFYLFLYCTPDNCNHSFEGLPETIPASTFTRTSIIQ